VLQPQPVAAHPNVLKAIQQLNKPGTLQRLRDVRVSLLTYIPDGGLVLSNVGAVTELLDQSARDPTVRAKADKAEQVQTVGGMLFDSIAKLVRHIQSFATAAQVAGGAQTLCVMAKSDRLRHPALDQLLRCALGHITLPQLVLVWHITDSFDPAVFAPSTKQMQQIAALCMRQSVVLLWSSSDLCSWFSVLVKFFNPPGKKQRFLTYPATAALQPVLGRCAEMAAAGAVPFAHRLQILSQCRLMLTDAGSLVAQLNSPGGCLPADLGWPEQITMLQAASGLGYTACSTKEKAERPFPYHMLGVAVSAALDLLNRGEWPTWQQGALVCHSLGYLAVPGALAEALMGRLFEYVLPQLDALAGDPDLWEQQPPEEHVLVHGHMMWQAQQASYFNNPGLILPDSPVLPFSREWSVQPPEHIPEKQQWMQQVLVGAVDRLRHEEGIDLKVSLPEVDLREYGDYLPFRVDCVVQSPWDTLVYEFEGRQHYVGPGGHLTGATRWRNHMYMCQGVRLISVSEAVWDATVDKHRLIYGTLISYLVSIGVLPPR
jgi:hypothetical protein